MTKNSRALPMFPTAAKAALADTQLRHNLGVATSTIRAKRARVVAELPDWEDLRAAGNASKAEVMRHLDAYLVQLEAAVQSAGGHVYWARDAAEANAIVTALVRAEGASEVVKVKSLTTDEIKLNDALAVAGITAHETDLAELIIQLAHDTSSHILVPAIHKNRAEIRELFLKTIARRQELSDQPADLAGAARAHLRRTFLRARVAISGANFAVAETGAIGVVESEGNGRMCLTLPQTLITIMGIEKIIPTWEDLGVFLQLLPRSSTAERMNPYTSIDGGAHEPVYVDLDRGDSWRRTASLPPDLAGQRAHAGAGGRRGSPGALLHPLQRLPEQLPGLQPDGGPCLWLGLPRPHWRHPDAATAGSGERCVAAVRLQSLRRVLRGLPSRYQHSRGAGTSAWRGGAPEAAAPRGQTRSGSGGDEAAGAHLRLATAL